LMIMKFISIMIIYDRTDVGLTGYGNHRPF
jgi:hypothetical protein